jgi:hypothetical protein
MRRWRRQAAAHLQFAPLIGNIEIVYLGFTAKFTLHLEAKKELSFCV